MSSLASISNSSISEKQSKILFDLPAHESDDLIDMGDGGLERGPFIYSSCNFLSNSSLTDVRMRVCACNRASKISRRSAMGASGINYLNCMKTSECLKRHLTRYNFRSLPARSQFMLVLNLMTSFLSSLFLLSWSSANQSSYTLRKYLFRY